MRILLWGMNHRSAPLAVRESFAVAEVGPALEKLCASPEIDEAVIFSTCNRVEIVVVTRDLEAARLRLRVCFGRELLRGDAPAPPIRLEDHLYEHLDADAMRHVLRVASSLDSMVVGEPQILGQTKQAYQTAVDCGAAGPILGRLFQHAFATAKRVRSETRIAERPVSVARVAAELATQIFEDLAQKTALLIGAGEMAELALSALRGAGLGALCVVNRSAERAAELALRFGASAHGLDELPALLAQADVVLCSIGGERPLLTCEVVERALAHRPERPLFVIDIGVPRNAEAGINDIEQVYLYDIDDLGALAQRNADERGAEAARAEAIVEEQRQRFDGWLSALRAVPTIQHLRERVEALRSAELEKLLRRIDLDAALREEFDAWSRSLVNKILHPPIARLRKEAEREEGIAYLEAARALFALDEAESDGE